MIVTKTYSGFTNCLEPGRRALFIELSDKGTELKPTDLAVMASNFKSLVIDNYTASYQLEVQKLIKKYHEQVEGGTVYLTLTNPTSIPWSGKYEGLKLIIWLDSSLETSCSLVAKLAKSGVGYYIFTDSDWTRITNYIIKTGIPKHLAYIPFGVVHASRVKELGLNIWFDLGSVIQNELLE